MSAKNSPVVQAARNNPAGRKLTRRDIVTQQKWVLSNDQAAKTHSAIESTSRVGFLFND